MITDWNQACLAKKATRCFQEETHILNGPIKPSVLDKVFTRI
jgi:hypothetical protein